MRDSHRSIVSVLANRPARAITCAMVAVALSAAPILSPATALAVSEQTQSELDAANQNVDDSTTAYNEAVTKLDELQKAIDENTAAIEQLEQEIPAQQQAASNAMRELYKYQQGSNPLVGAMVNAGSLSDFITSSTYMNQIQSSNSEAIEELNGMQAELEQKRTELDAQKQQLEDEKQRAADALAAAQQERQAAQAQAEAEAAAELAAAAADTAPASGSGGSNENPYNTATETNQTANVVVNPGVDWSSDDRSQFITEWSARIDAYLAGSPLAGHGATFAAAAWDYGVDPRWSPAISTIESSKGLYCANTCNAWGWTASGGGFRSFGSWDEAITAHARYLKNMYGTTLTPEAAKRYCPPTWQDWYNKVGSEMNRI